MDYNLSLLLPLVKISKFSRGKVENWRSNTVLILDVDVGGGGGWKWVVILPPMNMFQRRSEAVMCR